MPVGIVRTVSGTIVDLRDPKPGDIVLSDICHHLSLICRWGGAAKRHYSVAEHSLWVGRFVAEQEGNPVDGYLHDGHEYVLGDVITPLKRLLSPHDLDAKIVAFIEEFCPQQIAASDALFDMFVNYDKLCDKMDTAIYEYLGLTLPDEEQSGRIKKADLWAAWCEAQILTKHPKDAKWTEEPPDSKTKRDMLQSLAYQEFRPSYWAQLLEHSIRTHLIEV